MFLNSDNCEIQAGGYDKVDPSMNSHLIYPSNILSFLFGGRAKQLEWFTDTDSKAIEMMKNYTFWPLIEKLLDSNSSVPVCGTKGTELVNSKGLVKFHGYCVNTIKRETDSVKTGKVGSLSNINFANYLLIYDQEHL